MDTFKALPSRRLITLVVALFATSFLLVLFLRSTEYRPWPGKSPAPEGAPGVGVDLQTAKYPSTCGPENKGYSPELWEHSQDAYSHLADDKFTVAMLTYQRPELVKKTVEKLTEIKVPSLAEIVIIWNEVDKDMPKNFVKNGVPVRYRMSEYNSMNMKFVPDPLYKTQAILLHDDDLYLHPDDYEWSFQMWRSFGRNRMTGFLPRCIKKQSAGWHYSFCSKGDDKYRMVLSNLAFVHISFLDYFHSADPVMKKMRDHIDEVFNCDDLAINFITQMLTCTGALQLVGNHQYVSQHPKSGISSDPDHLKKRDVCLDKFSEWMGYMPLVEQTGRFVRGVEQING